MTNKPKNIGTRAESAVLKILLPYWPSAKRLVLAGAQDRGDIGDTGKFIFEVKGGKQADRPNDAALDGWMAEAKLEAKHSDVLIGVLVTQRAGFGVDNADHWYAWVPLNLFVLLGTGQIYDARQPAYGLTAPVRVELRHFLQMISDNGWVDG